MFARLDGKVALITGAGGGIGSEMTKLFAAEGAAVMANDVDEEHVEPVLQAVEAAAGRVLAGPGDVSAEANVRRVIERTIDVFGGLDILVNNAFAAPNDTTITDLDVTDWNRIIGACLTGPFLCTKHAIPAMRRRGGGSVITISSVNALFEVGEAAYTAAKGGLISLMRLVAAEYGEWKIRSNIICPGTIATKVSMDYWQQYPAGYRKLLDMYPLKRIGQPGEVAQFALFLASDESSFVTGAVHVIDGGLLAGRKLEVV